MPEHNVIATVIFQAFCIGLGVAIVAYGLWSNYR